MNAQARWSLLVLPLLLAAALIVQGESTSAGNPAEKKFQLPDAAFDELIFESNKYLNEELNGNSPYMTRVRSNALVIALACQHRMLQKKANHDQLATMRDAAVKIARAFDPDTGKQDLAAARKSFAILAEYPAIKADLNANPEILRLKSVFEQEDVDFQFKNRNKQVGIERELLTLLRMPKLGPDQLTRKLEMIGYKLALLAEQLRDFETNVRPQKALRRKEWVSHATDVQYNGWELADAVRTKNPDAVKAAVQRIDSACVDCHSKFRCD